MRAPGVAASVTPTMNKTLWMTTMTILIGGAASTALPSASAICPAYDPGHWILCGSFFTDVGSGIRYAENDTSEAITFLQHGPAPDAVVAYSLVEGTEAAHFVEITYLTHIDHPIRTDPLLA